MPYPASVLAFILPFLSLYTQAAATECFATLYDVTWPAEAEWTALNGSIGGSLLQSRPAASSCYDGNPLGSDVSCDIVEAQWSTYRFQGDQPESVGSTLFTNNSCLPPNLPTFNGGECTYGAYSRYIVNATIPEQIATAFEWAGQHNIRVVIKGTGHDLYGRSVGANSLSIWTRNFDHISHDDSFRPIGSAANSSADAVLVVGSGQTWGGVYEYLQPLGRLAIGGSEGTVGLGGHIQAGGHGALSSRFGVAANQVLQATVVTPTGEVLIANDFQNQDLFFAIRGGGPGNYGVVTEYVLKTYPTASFLTATIFMVASDGTAESRAAMWNASSELTMYLPDLMDEGLGGALFMATGQTAVGYVPSLPSPPNGPVLAGSLYRFDSTSDEYDSIIDPVVTRLQETYGHLVTIVRGNTTSFPTYYDYFLAQPPQPVSGEGLLSSRLLSRGALKLPLPDIVSYLQRLLTPQNSTVGNVLVNNLVAGPGPASIPPARQGAVLPAWRSTYIHAISANSVVANPHLSPAEKIADVTRFQNENMEPVWKEWEPETGSYMNEGNGFAETCQGDFYGSNLGRLREVKDRYDPKGLLWVQCGVGSERWDYSLSEGTLCRAKS